jgi:deazaflavin-dependent oxidoreductase (nitroreductase family)
MDETKEDLMAKPYAAPKTLNAIVRLINRFGLGRSQTLTTTGRVSGEPRKVPVTPIEVEGVTYLVAPYGAVSWVRNARVDPKVTLSSGGSEKTCRLVEVFDGAAPVVAAYYERESYPRSYMDVPDDPSLEDFESAAELFPVFRVEDAD